MVLTRRQYKAILRWLPNEIITEIIQVAPRGDREALCRTSKLFHAIGLPILYRDVNLDSGACAKFLCDSVLSNTTLPGLVRSFTFTIDGPFPPRCGYSSGKLLDCVKTFLRLEHLSIRLSLLDQIHQEVLLGWTFPQLVTFQVHTDCTSSTTRATLPSFVARHPQLISLSKPPYESMVEWPSRLQLSNLQYFDGPPQWIPFLDTRALREVQIDWFAYASYGDPSYDDPSVETVEQIVVALASMIRPNIPLVCSSCLYDDDFMEVVDAYAKCMPPMKTFQLNVETHDGDVMDELLEHLRTCLPRFEGLQFLAIREFDVDHSSHSTPNKDRILAKALGDACPTLQACCFKRTAWRMVDGTWEQFPVENFPSFAGVTFDYK
ncbi:hypothetical protein B0H11DRAFT_1995642 [Mycena galericulata]|nr:hypothetical protein B0H11DRAFT_1995642 [Mycena galericulata]